MKIILEKGRPATGEGRSDREIQVYDLLDSLKIPYERADHETAATMEACLAVDRVLAPAVICKNLFLCNAGKTSFYLLMLGENKKFVTKEISRQIGSPRLSFAPAEYMEAFLNITPGSVSVLGLMNDRDNRVKLLVDEDILNAECFGCHPCVNTSSLKLRTADVFDLFLPAVHHDFTVVRIE